MYSVNITDKEMARLNGSEGENGIQEKGSGGERQGKYFHYGRRMRARKNCEENENNKYHVKGESIQITPTVSHAKHLHMQLVNRDEDIALFA